MELSVGTKLQGRELQGLEAARSRVRQVRISRNINQSDKHISVEIESKAEEIGRAFRPPTHC